jgi:serine/threonine-protein kinase
MKSCPQCQRTFPNDAGFCPVDGTALSGASLVPVAPTSDDPRIGTRLVGRYELRRVVADGGMGRVYEGIDKESDSRVAIKILHPDVAKDEIAVERFKREYEINASLPHEHIVKVLDFQRDTVNDTYILVMEFLEGEELRYALKREKTLSPERLVRMISQVAIGLDEAHNRGFIHRDLKPDNVFLVGTREGDVVKLLDFGSAKDTGNKQKKLTVLGTTIGSPYYMAPEQAQGLETIDPRADVFALGAVLYECVAGEVPFTGTNGPSILLAILTKDPVPPTVKAGPDAKYPVAAGMDDVIELALAKNPNIRTKTVGVLADSVGQAYGLDGDHKLWATIPQAQLAEQITAGLAKKASQVSALGVAADPFAAPAGGGAAGDDMAAAFGAIREADMAAPGVPTSGKPPWLVPVIVGVLALLVGGVVTLSVMMK